MASELVPRLRAALPHLLLQCAQDLILGEEMEDGKGVHVHQLSQASERLTSNGREHLHHVQVAPCIAHMRRGPAEAHPAG